MREYINCVWDDSATVEAHMEIFRYSNDGYVNDDSVCCYDIDMILEAMLTLKQIVGKRTLNT